MISPASKKGTWLLHEPGDIAGYCLDPWSDGPTKQNIGRKLGGILDLEKYAQPSKMEAEGKGQHLKVSSSRITYC